MIFFEVYIYISELPIVCIDYESKPYNQTYFDSD